MNYNLSILDILDCRKTNSLPFHFSTTEISEQEKHETRLWIQNKLRGRYFLDKCPAISSSNKLEIPTIVGFEEEKELTYFMLACPYTRRK